MLSIKGERTFLFFNFLITGLHNSLANALFETFLFLTEDILNVLSPNILSEAVLLIELLKSLKSMSCLKQALSSSFW